MKKKLLIILISLILGVVAILAYALVNANSLIARFKPELERVVSNAVGAPVHLGALEASVFPSTSIKAKEFTIGEAGPKEGLSLGDLVLELKLLPLLQNQLDIVTLRIEKPKIVLVKTAAGVTLVGLPTKVPTSPDTPKVEAGTSGVKKSDRDHLEINLREIIVTDGEITMRDASSPETLGLSDLDFKAGLAISNGSINIKSIRFSSNIVGKGPNPVPVSLEGESVLFNLGKLSLGTLVFKILGEAVEIGGDIDTNAMSGKISLGSPTPLQIKKFEPLVAAFAPAAKAFQLQGGLTPAITVNLDNKVPLVKGSVTITQFAGSFADKKITDGSGVIALNATTESQRVSTETLAFNVNAIPLKVALDASVQGAETATLHALTLHGFSGTTAAAGKFNLKSKAFESDVKIADVDVSKLLELVKPELKTLIVGTISKIETQVNGTLGDALMSSLQGSGKYTITNAKLLGVNIASETLQAVNNIPLVNGSLYGLVPPELEVQLGGKDTPIELLQGDFSLSNSELNTTKMLLKSTAFALDADGAVGFDQKVDLKSSITFSPEFSKALAMKSREVRRIFDTEDRLVIPLLIKGTLPKVAVLPNVQRLIETAGRRAIEEHGAKVIEKVLGGKSGGKDLGKIFGF